MVMEKELCPSRRPLTVSRGRCPSKSLRAWQDLRLRQDELAEALPDLLVWNSPAPTPLALRERGMLPRPRASLSVCMTRRPSSTFSRVWDNRTRSAKAARLAIPCGTGHAPSEMYCYVLLRTGAWRPRKLSRWPARLQTSPKLTLGRQWQCQICRATFSRLQWLSQDKLRN